MRIRAGVIVLGLVVSVATPALAQQALSDGIQHLVRQMIRVMEQEHKRKVAILDFTKLDGSVDNFGRYIAERLLTEMFLTRRFAVVERRQLNKILSELELSASDLMDPNNAARLGKLHGVDAIASGSVAELATVVEVNARLVETETGRIIAAAQAQFFKNADVLALVEGSIRGAPSIDDIEVTNSAFKAFIDAGGYLRKELWSAAGWRWRESEKVREPLYWLDERANQPRHPVVGISWYEADAFCRFSGKRLPTSAEWDRAVAEGRLRASSQAREHFPIGLVVSGEIKTWAWMADMARETTDQEGRHASVRVMRGSPLGVITPEGRGQGDPTARDEWLADARIWDVGVRCAKSTQ